jgi:hypothetical protein
MAGLPDDLLAPPVNVLRASLHPRGLAPRIANFADWRDHLFERLAHQIQASGDPALAALAEELRALPAPAGVTIQLFGGADECCTGRPIRQPHIEPVIRRVPRLGHAPRRPPDGS